MSKEKLFIDRKLGIAGRMTHFFLNNVVLSILSIIVIVVWGILSFVIMPKQYNPEIVAPAFMITTEYPQASSQEIYEQITRPMEDKISELTNIDAIASQSLPGGRSIVTVKFVIGSDQEDAKISLNQKLQDNMFLKPVGAQDPLVQSIDPDDVPIIDIGLSSDVYSESSMRKMAFDVADALKHVSGVSTVDVIGGRKNQLSVSVRSAEMLARNISLDEIMRAISSANGVYTTDVIRGDERNFMLNVMDHTASPDDISRIIVREENGVHVTVGDVADVSYDQGDIVNYIDLTTRDKEMHPVVHIALAKLKGANATTVADHVEEKLHDLSGHVIPSDVHVQLLRNEGEVARSEIGKLTHDLIKSIAIVALLLMIFLGVRNSVVAAVSIPLVLLTVFGIGLLWGHTVNRITLFALILSLGLLVDDAIVVIENIARYFRLYPQEDKKRVIVAAVNEVGSALSLSTVTMALSFIPMAFVTGMMGPYMGPIPFFVPVALLASLVLSVTINPFLAFVFTKPDEKGYAKNFFLRGFEKMESWYAQFVAYILSSRKRYRSVIVGVTGIFVLSIILPFTPLVPFRMLPKADRDQFYVYVDLPQDAPVVKTREVARAVTDVLFRDQYVVNVESFVGVAPVEDFNGLFRGSMQRAYENQATLRVNLQSHEKRGRVSEKIAQDFRVHVQEVVQQYPDLSVRIVEDPPGPPVLATFLLKVTGDDDHVREQIADDLLTRVRAVRGIDDIDSSTSDHTLNYTYLINNDKAQQQGVEPAVIARTLRTALSGSIAGVYGAQNNRNVRHPEQEYIVVRLAREDRNMIEDLSLISVPTMQGEHVAIAEFLTKTDKSFDVPIITDERSKTTYISGEMVGRSVVYASLDILGQLRTYKIPDAESHVVSWSLFGVTIEDTSSGKRYDVLLDGEWKLTLEVFRDLGIAMGVAIFLIYFVLAAKIKSFFVPVLIMISIPLGFIGVFPGFAFLYLIKGTYFNATSMIGIIALSGLSVKNAVIFLEYLEPLRHAKYSLKDALVETGRIRLLPIVLTSLTAILGSLTIISDPVWEGLAWALIFGLTVSTVLTLVIFPLMYYAVMRDHWGDKS